MISRIFLPLAPFILAFAPVCAQQNADFLGYIEKYKEVAISEMERAGVPASIKLAQALLESNAGRSELARKANNHFGMKCGGSWTGKTYEKEDDDYDEFGNLKKSCFRRYRKAKDSFIAHSEFLRDPKKANRYGFLFRLDPLDYKRWARGLRRAGYATAAGYDTKLIRLIEAYELNRFDLLSVGGLPGEKPVKDKDIIAGMDVRLVNDARVVFAKNNVTVQEISSRSGISISRLKRYNEQLPAIDQPLPDDHRVYLQPKRCRHRGTRWHYVQEGETMYDISQEYGIGLNRLYLRNQMEKGSQPQVNERLKLKGFKIKKGNRPRLISEPKPTTVPVPLEPDEDFLEDEITPENPGTGQPPAPPTANPQPPGPDPEPAPTPPSPSGPVYYAVVKGDTLYSISRRYGRTVDELIQMNKLSSTTLSIGQVLQVK